MFQEEKLLWEALLPTNKSCHTICSMKSKETSDKVSSSGSSLLGTLQRSALTTIKQSMHANIFGLFLGRFLLSSEASDQQFEIKLPRHSPEVSKAHTSKVLTWVELEYYI